MKISRGSSNEVLAEQLSPAPQKSGRSCPHPRFGEVEHLDDEPDVRQRVSMLLDAHLGHPRLALSTAGELEGHPPNFENPPRTESFRRALFWGAHTPVQSCLFLAHRARLAILKAAVDYILLRRAGRLAPQVIRIFGQEIQAENGAYAAFNRCVDHFENAPNLHRYPVLWQTFMWAWGGFLLLSRRDEEMTALSAESGVPVDEFELAMSMFDWLFPTEGGWFNQPTGASRYVLKLMPAPLRGIGAYGRLLRYGYEDYGQFQHNDHTNRHMASDHNAGGRLLDCGDQELIA